MLYLIMVYESVCVLLQSTLEALRLEEAYHEETLNRACSIEDLGTRTPIESTRLLVDALQINKAKAKALLTSAKQVDILIL